MSRKKPRLGKPPSAEELAGWTAAQQQAALARRETELIAEAAKLEKPPEAERQKVRALKHLHRARNPLATRGDAQRAIELIDQALTEVESLS